MAYILVMAHFRNRDRNELLVKIQFHFVNTFNQILKLIFNNVITMGHRWWFGLTFFFSSYDSICKDVVVAKTTIFIEFMKKAFMRLCHGTNNSNCKWHFKRSLYIIHINESKDRYGKNAALTRLNQLWYERGYVRQFYKREKKKFLLFGSNLLVKIRGSLSMDVSSDFQLISIPYFFFA